MCLVSRESGRIASSTAFFSQLAPFSTFTKSVEIITKSVEIINIEVGDSTVDTECPDVPSYAVSSDSEMGRMSSSIDE